MYRIIRINLDNEENVAKSGIIERETAIRLMVDMANAKANQTPNNPHVDICGVDAVGVYIGIGRVESYRVEQEIPLRNPAYDGPMGIFTDYEG